MSKLNTKNKYNQFFLYITYAIGLICLMKTGQVNSAGAQTIGEMASLITGSFTQLTRLITAGSYIAGLGFAMGAILKFKQHKDNPTQIPIGTPIALTFIGAALLFLPAILSVTGNTMFGQANRSDVAGPTGTVFMGTTN